jgi:hypothetical protein
MQREKIYVMALLAVGYAKQNFGLKRELWKSSVF